MKVKLQRSFDCQKEIYSIETILPIIYDSPLYVVDNKKQSVPKVDLNGDAIKLSSLRMRMFKHLGTKCVCCGLEGSFFRKEKLSKDISFHLNLYGIDKNGNEVLMTKDHIFPKSLGGKDHLSNMQPMCVVCNTLKGNSIIKEGAYHANKMSKM